MCGFEVGKGSVRCSPESRRVTTEIDSPEAEDQPGVCEEPTQRETVGLGQSDRQGTAGAGAEASPLPQGWTDLRLDRQVTTRHTTGEVGRQLCLAEAQGHQQRLWCLSEARQGVEKGMW